MLNSDQYKTLAQIKSHRAFLALLFDWLVIALLFYICQRWPSFWLIAISMVLMARTQLALSVLMHEAAHQNLFKNAKMGDYVCQFLIAGPIFFSMYSYKRNHLIHHQIPLQPEDPDITLTGGYPVSKMSLIRKLVRDLFGVSYFKFIRYFLYSAHGRSRKIRQKELPAEAQNPTAQKRELMSPQMVVFSIILSNAVMISVLALFKAAWLYPLLWLIPSMTFLQVFLRIRGIAEHSGFQPEKNQMAISRTVLNRWQTFFVAPHNLNYHIEHHAYPKIPFYNLPQVHHLLLADGTLPQKNVFTSYWPILKSLVK